MAYVAPNWVNGGPPALDAEALNAISQALAKLPMENGGTFATSGAAGLYNLINAAATLTSGTLASGDYVGIKDVSAGTGKQVTLSNLASWIGSNGTGAKIATGSYTGTGTYGASNPNSITFPFAPKLVWMMGYNPGPNTKSFNPIGVYNYQIPWFPFSLLTTDYQTGLGFKVESQGSATARKSGNTIQWFSSVGAGQQCNASSFVYHWIAFG